MSQRLLVIGNRNYSSWSLRGWLMMQASGLQFDVLRLSLDSAEFYEQIGSYSPSNRVPVLLDGSNKIWDTLALGEYLHEKCPKKNLWPADALQRAYARSISAEMHSGFPALRSEMPMNCRARNRRVTASNQCSLDIKRIEAIWAECGERYGGPWLFDDFGIADAMFAPVALRFLTYGVNVNCAASLFLHQVEQDPWIGAWVAKAAAEQEILHHEEKGA